MNSKKKGDVGLGSAIAYFTSAGNVVCIPLTDSQDYDLVIEIEGLLKKVQVKYTSHQSEYGKFIVGLRVLGGNTKSNFVSKYATDIVYDLLYVFTSTGERYLIDKSVFSKVRNTLTLGSKYEKFRIN